MMVGTDHSEQLFLYRDVTMDVNGLIAQAVKETKEIMRDKEPLATLFQQHGFKIATIYEKRIKEWADKIKDGGAWDYKNHHNIFGKPSNDEDGKYSKYFMYSGANGKTYTLKNGHNIPRLLRNDDPGNLAYAATGAVALFEADDWVEKWGLLFASDAYAAGKAKNDALIKNGEDPMGIGSMLGTGMTQVAGTRIGEFVGIGLLLGMTHSLLAVAPGLLTILKSIGIGIGGASTVVSVNPIIKFDHPHDLAVIEWGYDAFITRKDQK